MPFKPEASKLSGGMLKRKGSGEMDKTKLVGKHLKNARLMQLATVSSGKPWVCTLYFICDDQLNFYWLSLPTRRHSKEIEKDPNCAIAVAVNDRQPVIGVQAQGKGEQIADMSTITKILPKYVAKYGNGKDFVKAVRAGTSQHRFYRFVPDELVLFDEVNFPSNPKQNVL